MHVLNGCKVSLKQDRFTWRHDSIIKYIYDNIDSEKYEVYADLDNCRVSESVTVPPHIIVTSHKPDLVIIDNQKSEIHIFELTVPFETNIETRHLEKSNKYSNLTTDIDIISPHLTCFEVGSRGYLTPDNRKRLKTLQKFCKKSISHKQLMKEVSQIAISTSYYIFLTRNDYERTMPKPLNGNTRKT